MLIKYLVRVLLVAFYGYFNSILQSHLLCCSVLYCREILTEELYDIRTGLPVVVDKRNRKLTKREKLKQQQLIEENSQYYRTYDLCTIQKASPAAAAFYIWVSQTASPLL